MNYCTSYQVTVILKYFKGPFACRDCEKLQKYQAGYEIGTSKMWAIVTVPILLVSQPALLNDHNAIHYSVLL